MKRLDKLTDLVKARAGISEIGSDFEPEPPTDDDNGDEFEKIEGPSRKKIFGPQRGAASRRITESKDARAATQSDPPSMAIDPRLLQMDTAAKMKPNAYDSTYGSSSPAPDEFDHAMAFQKKERKDAYQYTDMNDGDTDGIDSMVFDMVSFPGIITIRNNLFIKVLM
jgi:hypothetical protein